MAANYNEQDYEEVVIPPAMTVPPRDNERLIPVTELDPLAQGSFRVCLSKYLLRKTIDVIHRHIRA